MRVAIFGASGMVGKGVLLECLDDPRVSSVLVVGRRSCGVTHSKLEEVLHQDFFDFSAMRDRFAGLDACFFTLGTTSAGKTEADYTRQTYDLTLPPPARSRGRAPVRSSSTCRASAPTRPSAAA